MLWRASRSVNEPTRNAGALAASGEAAVHIVPGRRPCYRGMKSVFASIVATVSAISLAQFSRSLRLTTSTGVCM